LNVVDTPDGFDSSLRSAASTLRQERSADKNKGNRKMTSSKIELPNAKLLSDAASVKSKAGESEQNSAQVDLAATANNEQQDSQSKTND
ncbi:unnamed protein product, partial [Adineta steineri]